MINFLLVSPSGAPVREVLSITQICSGASGTSRLSIQPCRILYLNEQLGGSSDQSCSSKRGDVFARVITHVLQGHQRTHVISFRRPNELVVE